MYGWRGRIGLLVPSINTTMETEFWRIAPEGVSVHSARIAGGRHGTPEELRSMENASKKAAEEVAHLSVPKVGKMVLANVDEPHGGIPQEAPSLFVPATETQSTTEPKKK